MSALVIPITMKKTLLPLISASLLAITTAVSSGQLDPTYEPADAMLFFRNPYGAVGVTETLGVSLGSTWDKFRRAATPSDPTYGTVLDLGNIGSVLTQTYGDDWTALTGVLFAGVAGNNGGTSNLDREIYDGDYARTVYVTKPRSGAGTLGERNSTIAQVNPNNSSGVSSAIEGANSSLPNNASPGLFNTPNTANNNPIATNPNGGFIIQTAYTAIAGGIVGPTVAEGGTFSYGELTDVALALDLYRVTPNVTGATAWQNANAISGVTAGVGYYLGTLTLQTNGDLRFTAVGAGQTDEYAEWAAGYAPANLTDKNADFDRDGFTNGSEFAYGTNPTVGNASLTDPQPVSGNLVVTFLRRASVSYSVQKSANLADAFVTDPAVTVARYEPQGTVPSGYEKVFFSQPATGKSFYRVQVTLP